MVLNGFGNPLFIFFTGVDRYHCTHFTDGETGRKLASELIASLVLIPPHHKPFSLCFFLRLNPTTTYKPPFLSSPPFSLSMGRSIPFPAARLLRDRWSIAPSSRL